MQKIMLWFYVFYTLFQYLGKAPLVYAFEDRMVLKETSFLDLSSSSKGWSSSKSASFFLVDKSASVSLSEREEKILLKGIDSLCSDSWCEGSFDFAFHTLSCQFENQECALGFRFISLYDEPYGWIPGNFEFVCVIEVENRSKLFGAKEDFWISAFFYEVVDQCIEKAEPLAWKYYEKLFFLPAP